MPGGYRMPFEWSLAKLRLCHNGLYESAKCHSANLASTTFLGTIFSATYDGKSRKLASLSFVSFERLRKFAQICSKAGPAQQHFQPIKLQRPILLNILRPSFCRGHSSSIGKASWIKVPQRGATKLTWVWFLVAASELGEKICATPSVGVGGETQFHRNKSADWVSSKKT